MQDFEVVGTRGFFRPVARVSFEQGADLIVIAMKQARALNLPDLLVNILGLTGFEPLKIFERYAMATKWVESGGAALRVAWVLKPELIDPQKIGIVMAQNRGASGDVFATEAEALAWLDAPRTGGNASRGPFSDPDRPD
jgi:hypothetical protein